MDRTPGGTELPSDEAGKMSDRTDFEGYACPRVRGGQELCFRWVMFEMLLDTPAELQKMKLDRRAGDVGEG